MFSLVGVGTSRYGFISANSSFSCQTLALIDGEVSGFVFTADDKLPEPQKFIRVARGAGVAQHRLAIEAKENKYRRGTHAVFLEGKILFRHFAATEIGQRRVAARVHMQQAKVLAIVVLHHRLAQHRGLHLLTPRTVGIVEHNKYPELALLLRERQIILKVAETLLEEVGHRVTCRCQRGYIRRRGRRKRRKRQEQHPAFPLPPPRYRFQE